MPTIRYAFDTPKSLISDYATDTATFDANEQSVANLLADLEKSILEVWAFDEISLTSAILTSSSIAAWAQAKSFLLRDPILNPSHLGVKDMNFFKIIKGYFTQLIANVNQSKVDEQNALDGIPHDGSALWFPPVPLCAWTFDSSSTTFKKGWYKTIPWKELYIAIPNSNNVQQVLNATYSFVLPGGALPKVLFAPVDLNVSWIDPKNVATARQVWPTFQAKIVECKATAQYLLNSDQAFAAMSKALS